MDRMDVNTWMNNTLPELVDDLHEAIVKGHRIQETSHLGLAGRNEIYEILELLLAILFPGRYSKESVPEDDLSFYLHESLRHVSYKFLRYLKDAYRHFCLKREPDCSTRECDDCAAEALYHLVESLSKVRSALQLDVEAAFGGDPAAQSVEEIILSYPTIDAISTYRNGLRKKLPPDDIHSCQ